MSSERYFSPRYRVQAIVVAAVAAVLSVVGFLLASVRISSPPRSIAQETSLFDLGVADWVPYLMGALLVIYGAYRLARRDSQARGFLIVGGGMTVLLATWEILTIQDRVLGYAAEALPGGDPAATRKLLDTAVSQGLLRITVNIGVYLILIGGLLALTAVVLCFVSGRRSTFPTAVPAPPPPVGAMLGGREVTQVSAAIHPVGERCTVCKAILADDTNVCWYCGRLWSPSPVGTS